MIGIRPAKSVQGNVALPVSPDLLFMAALSACATARKIKISGVDETDVVDDIIRAVKGHAAVELNDSILQISPLSLNMGDDPSVLLTLPDSLFSYRAIYLFMGLGMGKTVLMPSAPLRQLEYFIAIAEQIGVTVETVAVGERVGLRASRFDGYKAETCYPNEDDCAALLAFLFGKGEKLTFSIADYHLSTPLRQLARAFGFTCSVKSAENDDYYKTARRIRFLQGKQRTQQAQSQIFIVDADFSQRSASNDNCCISADNIDTDKNEALNITIPGDDVLAAALITLKCIVPKGTLEIFNVPLESWASQTISFIKKMGGKINAKESCKTTFGSCGIVSVSKSNNVGRKTRCVPFYQYIGQLPCMTVAAAFADGKSVFRELNALRLFEPDGLNLLEKWLRPLGIRHGEMPDGIVIEGAKEFDGFDIQEPLPAHVAGAFCIAGLKCVGKTSIVSDCITARWPKFENLLNEICEFKSY